VTTPEPAANCSPQVTPIAIDWTEVEGDLLAKDVDALVNNPWQRLRPHRSPLIGSGFMDPTEAPPADRDSPTRGSGPTVSPASWP